MFTSIRHILPITVIRRERFLPIPGKVLVRTQQKVAAADTIAEANLHPEFLMVDVGRGLGMSPGKADPNIRCSAGDTLVEGDIVAGPVGFTRRLIRSPRDGKVILVGNGQILIELTMKPFLLKAGLSGTVIELVSDKGVVIETTGALIQGIWGNGGIDAGIMISVPKEADQILTVSNIDIALRGSIVFAHHCQDPQALKFAEELPLRGLILASMTPDLIPIAKKLRIPVIVIEGFGYRKFNGVIERLLSTNEKREVALNAEPWNQDTATRPEVVIPLPATSSLSPPHVVTSVAPGQRVHILRPPHIGEVGTVINLVGVIRFPSGLRAPAAEILLENGGNQVFPIPNLELLA